MSVDAIALLRGEPASLKLGAPGPLPSSIVGPIAARSPEAVARRQRKLFAGALSTAILVAGFVLAALIYVGYQSAIREAEKDNRNLVVMLRVKLDATIARAEATINEATGEIPIDAMDAGASARYADQIRIALDRKLSLFPELGSLRVFNANGDFLYGSTSNGTVPQAASVGSQPRFRELRDHPSKGLVIFDTASSVIPGQRQAIVAGALIASDGHFLGAIAARVSFNDVAQLFSQLDLDHGSQISIRRADDSTLVTAWPLAQGAAGTPSGRADPFSDEGVARAGAGGIATHEVRQAADGTRWVVSMGALDHYPLYITAARRRGDVLADWYERSWAMGMVAALILAAMSALILRLRQSGIHEVRAARELAVNEQQLRLMASLFEHGAEPGWVCNAEPAILAINAAFTRVTGISAEEAVGRHPRAVLREPTTDEGQQEIDDAIRTIGYWQGELRGCRQDGTMFPRFQTISAVRDASGAITHFVCSCTDISERKEAEEKIFRLAHHDPLTGLANRFSLQSRLEQALSGARRDDSKVGVVLLDMDRFKSINDTLGHPVGDKLLIEVARRLSTNIRDSDVAARLGGDEFVVVLTGLRSADSAARRADRILRDLARPYVIDGRELHSTPSIGISLFPDDGNTVEVLVRSADTAMYHAKSNGRNNFQFFTAAMNVAAEERLELEFDLRRAIEQGDLFLHYQPQVDATDGRLLGVEALARWNHPTRGAISPLKFIPIAEETGLINELGEWVLRAALRQLRNWRDSGHPISRVSVNLSTHQLRNREFTRIVTNALDAAGLEGSNLELEITESAAMKNVEATISVLRELRAIGVELAIDDFGTGYSSLNHLKLLPISRLKLDQSFVRDAETDPNDAAICAASIALAHSLGLGVVAEGVETKAQLAYIRSLGGDVIQGYYFAMPGAPSEIEAYFFRTA